MAHAFFIKRNDRLPTITRTLRDTEGDPVDLTTASSVAFHMRASGAASPLIATTCSVLVASAGQVEYAWGIGETATAGYFEAEFQVAWPASKMQTFPNVGHIPITVRSEIG